MKRQFTVFLGLLFVALAVHGPLLLNDGVYWDGWLLYWLRKEGDFGELARWTSEAGGVPFPLVLRWSLGVFPDPTFGFKLAAFVSLFAAAWFSYLLALRVGGWNRIESTMLALLSLVYPAYQIAIEINATKYLVTYALFFAGAYLGCRAEMFAGFRHMGARLASALCFALSFGTGSLLVFYGGYVAVWLIDVGRRQSMGRADWFRFLLRRSDVFLLPFVYRLAVLKIFPARGDYDGYNALSFSRDLLRTGFTDFYRDAIEAHWTESLNSMWHNPWIGLGAVIVATIAFLCTPKSRFTAPAWTNRWGGVVTGLVFLVLGTLPYVLVGKPATRSGWDTRHALLVALPVAVTTVAIVRAVCAGRNPMLQRAGFSLLAVFVWLFAVSTWRYYLGWQARWVKDRSVITQLRDAAPDVRRHSVFRISDRCPLGGETDYRFYEWAGIFRSAWGDESHVGVDALADYEQFLARYGKYFNHRYQLSGFDPRGAQMALDIERGPAFDSPARLALAYWRVRFVTPQAEAGFLRNVVHLSFRRTQPSPP